MPEVPSLLNIGELSKPATVLIEKISEAVGAIFKPLQIERVARAEAKAAIIKSEAETQITELQRRALNRWIGEEAHKQANMESIISKSLPLLSATSKPQEMENDWVTNFFDKCRLISDKEMQTLWAKLLSGEANSPGAYSKRTVNLVAELDKQAAVWLSNLCRFAAMHGDQPIPLIYDLDAAVYAEGGIFFGMLTHLDSIGLVKFEALSGFSLNSTFQPLELRYQGTSFLIESKLVASHPRVHIGKVLFTQSGMELARICEPKAIPSFVDFFLDKWVSDGLVVSSPYPYRGAAI
jgi:hypothetical protein